MRKEFTMTKEQLEKILEASKPVPLIMIQYGMPPSQQDNANAAWKTLGEELKFKYMTVQSVSEDQRRFTAEVKED